MIRRCSKCKRTYDKEVGTTFCPHKSFDLSEPTCVEARRGSQATRTQTPTSIRLSPQAEALRIALAAKLGVNKSAVIEMAIRQMAKRERLDHDSR